MKVKCCFCGKKERYNYKEIRSTKHEKDENEGKHICCDCLYEHGYFECPQCNDFYKIESQECTGTCRDCFKGR